MYTFNRANEVFDGTTKIGTVERVRIAYTASVVSYTDGNGERRLRRVERHRPGWVASRAPGSYVEDPSGVVVRRTRREWADPKAWPGSPETIRGLSGAIADAMDGQMIDPAEFMRNAKG